MKAPVSLPGVKKGEEVPPSGVSTQAFLGFLMPFLLIAITAIVVYFVIRARLHGGGGAEGLLNLLVW